MRLSRVVRFWARHVVEALLGLSVLVAVGRCPVAAQEADQAWSAPTQLSREKWAWFPVAAVDSQGWVHLLWPETEGPEPAVQKSDVLIYTAWDGESWSAPVDVLLSPGGGPIQNPDLAADRSGHLHVVWNDGRQFWYSRGEISEAGSARGWSTPLPVGNGTYGSAAIVAEGTSTLHLAYADPNAGVYYLRSEDSGAHWSSPSDIVLVSGASEGVMDVRIAVGGDGSLHVVWTGIPLPDGYPPLGVWYTKSADDGETWSEPVQVAGEDYGEGNVLVTESEAVHLAWHGRVGVGGTFHQWSADGGQTWSPVTQLFGGSGLTRYPALAVDSSGTLHLADTSSAGLSYCFWKEGVWSSPQSVEDATVNGTFYEPHHATLAVRNGNDLFLFWTRQGVGDVAYSVRRVSAPYVAPPPLGTPPANVSVEAVRPAPALPVEPTEPAESAPQPSVNPVSQVPEGPVGGPTIPPLAAGMTATFVAVAVAALVARLRRR